VAYQHGGRDGETTYIERRVGRIRACLERYHPRVYGAPYAGILHGPSAADAVARFLAGEGRDFPPSYKLFLAMHNGWSGYVRDFTLVGVDSQHTVDARRDIEQTLDIINDTWSGERSRQIAESIAGRGGQRQEPGPWVGRMIPFGTDFNGALLLFDPRTRREDGEMDVLVYDTSGASKWYDGFAAMLEADSHEICEEPLDDPQ
jgi:SMI1/KNR4 family protein SUKH-1